jgi:hypothetical protein
MHKSAPSNLILSPFIISVPFVCYSSDVRGIRSTLERPPEARIRGPGPSLTGKGKKMSQNRIAVGNLPQPKSGV